MSANDAKPTGEVKNPDEPYFGDEGVNYDTYADDSSIGGPEKTDINFDSADLENRQKTEYFVNIAGAEKMKREEERRQREEKHRRVKEVLKAENNKKTRSIKTTDNTVKIQQQIRRRSFMQKYGAKGAILSVLAVVFIAAIIIGGGIIVKNIQESEKPGKIADLVGQKTDDVQEVRQKYLAESDEYYNAMQEIIDGAEYDEAKAELLLMRAEDLYNCGDIDHINKAKEDAYKSEQLNPTINSAYWISVIEKKIGNDDKAEEYSKIQTERIQELSERGGGNGQG